MDESNRNKRRKEKRKRNKPKRNKENDTIIKDAKERVKLIQNRIVKEYNQDEKIKDEKIESVTSRNIIHLLLNCLPNKDNHLMPEAYSFYDTVLISNKKDINDKINSNYIILDGNNTTFVIKDEGRTKNSKSIEANLVEYKFNSELRITDETWTNPKCVWSDKKGFGRGIKRRLTSFLDIPESSGYGLSYFIKDLELVNNGRSVSSKKIWKNTVEEILHEDLNSRLKNFISNVHLDTEGFIAYDEMNDYRSDRNKNKFNSLVEEHFNIKKGHRRLQKRGFKGISWCKDGP